MPLSLLFAIALLTSLFLILTSVERQKQCKNGVADLEGLVKISIQLLFFLLIPHFNWSGG